jgi:hypothetical protein
MSNAAIAARPPIGDFRGQSKASVGVSLDGGRASGGKTKGMIHELSAISYQLSAKPMDLASQVLL